MEKGRKDTVRERNKRYIALYSIFNYILEQNRCEINKIFVTP